MKKYLKLNSSLTIMMVLLLSFTATNLFAQVPSTGIFFQAVARDNFANPAKDRKVYVQSSIVQTTATGTKVLIEEFQTTTDATGVFSISIGQGTRVGGTVANLTSIDWASGPYFLNLKVSITPVAPTSTWDYKSEWVDLGTTSFGAVPYALYAGTATGLDGKLNSKDTAGMLLVYAKVQAVQTLENTVGTKVASADTALMLAPYKKIVNEIIASNITSLTADAINSALDSKVNLVDSNVVYVTPKELNTASDNLTSAINLKLDKNDTASLSNRIDTKANTIDINAALDLKAPLNSPNLVTPNLGDAKSSSIYIGTNTINTAAVLDVESTSKGVLLPRMTLSQRNAIDALVQGLIIYCTNCNGGVGELQIYNGKSWDKMDASNKMYAPGLEIDQLFIPTVVTNGSSVGQGFLTGSSGGYISKIITNAIGGVTGTQLTNGIANSVLKIRKYVNDVEIGTNNALTGQVLTTSIGDPTILDYNYGESNPTTEFNFPSGVYLDANTKYVIQFVNGEGVDVYVKVPSQYADGQAYDIDGVNLSLDRDFPFQLYLAKDTVNYYAKLNSKAPINSPTFTGTVSGITKEMVGLGNIDNTTDLGKPISTATQTALDLKEPASNKSININTDATSDIKFPSVKSVKTYVDDAIVIATTPDADANIKGKLALAGDLTGTAAEPRIAVDAITTTKIKDANITTVKINDAAVTTEKIADANVTDAKIVTVSGSKVTGNINGNAATATKIATPVTINGVAFDGSSNITISSTGTNGLTMNNSGAGEISGTVYDASVPKIVSYNTIGASPLAGSSSLTTVGTITAGTWNGNTIAIANGGTGATNGAAARTNLGLAIGVDVLAQRTFGTAANNNTEDFESAITAGITAQYWRGDKSWQTLNTSIVPEGTNLYYTTTRANADFDAQLATKSTTDLTEGNNLYYTDARVKSALNLTTTGNSGAATYSSTTGTFNIPEYTLAGLGYSLNGLSDVVQTFTTTTTGTDFGITSASGVHTFSLPDASVTARGLVTTGSQTFAGVKTFSNDIIANLTGNATTATKFASGRTISATGDITYTSESFDGSANVTGVATLVNSGVVSGTYGSPTEMPSITIDSKGRIINATTTSIIAGVNTVDAIATSSNANGATISGTTITLTPADASNGGVVTTGNQTFAGFKSFNTQITVPSIAVSNGTLSGTGASNWEFGTTPGLTSLKLSQGGCCGRLIIDENGRFAIGANYAPTTYQFDVQGNARFTQDVTAPSFIGSLTGNATTATTAGNITATSNSTLTSLTSLTEVGTITSGTWSGTTIAVANGGTGATTATAALTNLGAEAAANKSLATDLGGLSPSNNLFPTQKAVKDYVDGQFSSGGIATGSITNDKLAGSITASNLVGTDITKLGTITTGTWSSTTIAVANGGTGLTSIPAGYIPFGYTATSMATDAKLSWDNTNKTLGIGAVSDNSSLQITTTKINDGIQIFGNQTSGTSAAILLRVNLSDKSFNNLTQPGDAGIFFSPVSGGTAKGFLIAPHASGPSGMRMDASGNTNFNGTLGVSGATTISGILTAGGIAYPNTNGTSGQYLKTNGSGTASWASIPSNDLSTSAVGILPIANGGTGADNTSTALNNLGAEPTANKSNNSLGNSTTLFPTQYAVKTYVDAQLNTATDANTVSTIVKRDGSGNFSAGTITASLIGNASTASVLQTARNINGVAFNGGSDITIAADANTLTGTSLASNVINSSLTRVGTITSGTWSGTTIAVANGGTGLSSVGTSGQVLSSNGTSIQWLSPAVTAAITSLNGSTNASQTFATPGNIGTAPSWSTASGVHTLNIPMASASLVTAGLLSNSDYNNFTTAYTNRITSVTASGTSGAATINGNVLNIPTYSLAGLGGIDATAISATAPLSYIASGTASGTISIAKANTSSNGYLSKEDWTSFNDKIDKTALAANNGVATLGPTGRIPSEQLPDLTISSVSVLPANADITSSTYTSSYQTGAFVIIPSNTTSTTTTFINAGTYTSSSWVGIAANNNVTSVNGKIGNTITLTTSDIAEGTNKYYTDARVRAAIALTTTGTGAATYSSTSGELNIPTYSLPIASSSNLGGVKAGSNISIDINGVISGTASSTLTGTSDRIAVTNSGSAYTADIAATYTGQNSITTLGTITAGTWSGTTISIANGGTGASSTAAALTNLGAEAAVNKSTATSLGTSDNLFPTQNAVKSYVDTKVSGATIPDATTIATGKIQLAGDLGGSATSPTVTKVGTKTSAEIVSAVNTVNAATSTNTSNTIIYRDALGNFSAGTITANLSGRATTANALTNGRTISTTGDVTYTSGSFDGSADVTGVATLVNSGVVSGTYGSSTAIPALTIDSKGRITSATTTSIIAGVNTIGSIAVSSNANGATVSGTTLTLTPADAANGGVVTTGTQTFAGAKTFNSLVTGSISGNAGTATALATARTIAITGDLTYTSPSFDGSGNITAAGSLATTTVAAGSYGSSTAIPTFTVDSKGRLTAASTVSIIAGVNTVGSIAGTSNAAGATISGTSITLTPADGTNGGVVTNGVQTFAGAKTFSSTITGSISGNAGTATKLQTGRTIALTGDVTYISPNFDGSGAVTAAATLSASGVTAGTYGSSTAIPALTIDSKGRVTSATTTSIVAGVNTVASIAGTSNAAGATINGTTITLTPADGTNGGVVTNGTQTFAGIKTFSNNTASTSTSNGAVVVTGGIGVGGAIYAGSIQNTPIGSTTASTGAFTTLSASGATTLNGNTSVTGTNTLTVGTGATSLGGTLGVTGATTLAAVTTTGIATFSSTVKIPTGAGVSKVLTSDAIGNATWAYGAGATSTKTAAYTITLADKYVFYGSTATAVATFTLPLAAGNAGKEIIIKNKSAYTLTVQKDGAETIFQDNANAGVTSIALGIEASNNWVKLVSDGTQWVVFRALF